MKVEEKSFLQNSRCLFFEKKTRKSLIWSSLLNESFISFFGLLIFILRKDLFASTFQVSLFTALKPAVAFLSFYWSSNIKKSRVSLRNNMIIAGVLARLPFLLIFFFSSTWYIIFASAMYMLFSRAAIPAWMEVLKLNLKKNMREKLFSLSSILAYSEGVLIVILIGSSLDKYQNFWKFFLFFSTILGLISVFLQYKTPIYIDEDEVEKKQFSLNNIIQPWKDGILLLKKRPDFLKYQIGTMLCGFGIMLVMPALTIFYANHLNLAYSQLAISRYVFMGLGYVALSPIWARAMRKKHINFLTGFVCFGFALFPLLVLFANISKSYIYIAFLSYGITQAGSSLIWNLSGPTFANDEDSSKYSGINVLTVGIRGLIAPFLGGLFLELFSIYFVFALSIMISLAGSFIMFRDSFSFKKIFLKEKA